MSKARALVTAIALFVAGVAAFGAFVVADLQRAGPPGEPVRVVVSEGASFASVARNLVERGLVRRAWTLEFFAKATRGDRRIQTGTYEFTRGEPALDILGAMIRGDILAVFVTVPEGFTTWQIAGAVRAAGIDSVTMLAACRDADLRHALGVTAESLEGYLFPDTYRVPFGSDARDVVAQMLTRFHAAWTPQMERRASEIGMARHEVVTMASIIEAEAQVPDERPVVSAVYHNRLRRGMKLDADPTVAYAMGGFRGRLYFKDLKIDSPYNTYRYAGLPPGPICSPGESSLRAALHPEPSVDALYFVARGDGRHVFSSSLREHDAAVRSIRRSGGTPGR
jgi:peptidoglycan lytic transglycosylase G